MNIIIGTKYLMENIKVDVKEVKQVMENQGVRKVLDPDGVSYWIMKECSNQLAGGFTKGEQSTATMQKSKYCANSQRSR